MPASSMLLFVLVMWSVPVIIYAVLFFPELKQAVANGARSTLKRHGENDNASNVLSFEYLLPMVAAASMALMFGLLAGISWPVCLMLMCAGAALIGGVAYTFLKMHSIANPKEARNPDRAARHDPQDADRLAESETNSPAEIKASLSLGESSGSFLHATSTD